MNSAAGAMIVGTAALLISPAMRRTAKKSFITSSQCHCRHSILLQLFSKRASDERTKALNVIFGLEREMKHLSYFIRYHRGDDKNVTTENIFIALGVEKHLPHCFCSFNMYLKLINFSKKEHARVGSEGKEEATQIVCVR
jgi:hypothetical protein